LTRPATVAGDPLPSCGVNGIATGKRHVAARVSALREMLRLPDAITSSVCRALLILAVVFLGAVRLIGIRVIK